VTTASTRHQKVFFLFKKKAEDSKAGNRFFLKIMEATKTIADALLDDLDDLMDSDDDNDDQEQQQEQIQNSEDNDGDDDNGDQKPSSSGLDGRVANKSTAKSAWSRFLDSPNLHEHLKRIREHAAQQQQKNEESGKLQARNKEQEEENHQLVYQSNKYLASLAEEMGKAHGELAKAYKPKFAELEELLPNFLQYKTAVRIIGNEMDLIKVNDELNEILNSNQIITISVAASTTTGRPLTEEELQNVDEAATYLEELLEVQKELVTFVENSMESLCPSICALIGPSTAAKLLGLTGGLHELTKIPSCNLQVIGQVKQNSESRAGLSGISLEQHVGLLAEADLVQSLSKQYQKKALKVVAAKLALAARFDFVNVDTGRPRSASTGLKFREEVLEKFEKWQEPDKAPVLKALPKKRQNREHWIHMTVFYGGILRFELLLLYQANYPTFFFHISHSFSCSFSFTSQARSRSQETSRWTSNASLEGTF
jgi:U4/U6 small nuclear ribonucleoprotein PRP31